MAAPPPPRAPLPLRSAPLSKPKPKVAPTARAVEEDAEEELVVGKAKGKGRLAKNNKPVAKPSGAGSITAFFGKK